MREFARHTALYGLSDATLAALGVVTTPILTRLFEPSDYGVRELIANAVAFLFPVMLLGMESALPSFYVDPARARERRTFVSTAFFAFLGWAITLTVVLALVAPALARSDLGDGDHIAAFRFAILGVLPLLIVTFAKYVLRFEFAAARFVALAVSTGVLVAVGGLAGAYLTSAVRGFYMGQLGAALAPAAVAVWLIRDQLGGGFSLSTLRELLSKGIPYVAAAFLYLAFVLSDRQVIAALGNAKDVGVYALGIRVATLPLVLLTVVNLAWVPLAARAYHAGPGFSALVEDAMRYVAAVFTFIAVGLVAFGREVIAIAAPSSYGAASDVIAPLTLAVVIGGLGTIPAVTEFIVRRPSLVLAFNGIALVANVAVSVLLFPRFGIVGVAWGVVSGQLLWAGCYVAAAPRLLPGLSIRLGRPIVSIAVGIAAMLLLGILPTELTLPTTAARVLIVTGFIAVLFAFRIIGVRELRFARDAFRRISRDRA